MAWSGQFSDFDNFVLPNARGNIQDSKPRSTKPHNIQKESDKSNIRLEDINLGYSSIVVRQIQPIAALALLNPILFDHWHCLLMN